MSDSRNSRVEKAIGASFIVYLVAVCACISIVGYLVWTYIGNPVLDAVGRGDPVVTTIVAVIAAALLLGPTIMALRQASR